MPPVEQDALIYGPIRVELLTHKVLAQGKFVRLAKMEYRLLCYLILHEGQVLSRQEILTNIWNLPPNVKTRTLDMHMAQGWQHHYDLCKCSDRYLFGFGDQPCAWPATAV
mgnify:CR=1 FL=1